MHRGAWWATVPGVAESDMTEQLTLSLSYNRCYHQGESELRTSLYYLVLSVKYSNFKMKNFLNFSHDLYAHSQNG